MNTIKTTIKHTTIRKAAKAIPTNLAQGYSYSLNVAMYLLSEQTIGLGNHFNYRLV